MTSLVPRTTLLTFRQLEEMLQEVRVATIVYDEYELASNPVRDASERLFQQLCEAAQRVSNEGRAALKEASDRVVHEWDQIRRELGERAIEVLVKFQEQIAALIGKAMQAIAKAVTVVLEPVPGLVLDTLTFKQAWAVSPSVGVSVTEWLRLTITTGAEVALSYKVAPSAKPGTLSLPPDPLPPNTYAVWFHPDRRDLRWASGRRVGIVLDKPFTTRLGIKLI